MAEEQVQDPQIDERPGQTQDAIDEFADVWDSEWDNADDEPEQSTPKEEDGDDEDDNTPVKEPDKPAGKKDEPAAPKEEAAPTKTAAEMAEERGKALIDERLKQASETPKEAAPEQPATPQAPKEKPVQKEQAQDADEFKLTEEEESFKEDFPVIDSIMQKNTMQQIRKLEQEGKIVSGEQMGQVVDGLRKFAKAVAEDIKGLSQELFLYKKMPDWESEITSPDAKEFFTQASTAIKSLAHSEDPKDTLMFLNALKEWKVQGKMKAHSDKLSEKKKAIDNVAGQEFTSKTGMRGATGKSKVSDDDWDQLWDEVDG